jgi:hypothetical protein
MAGFRGIRAIALGLAKDPPNPYRDVLELIQITTTKGEHNGTCIQDKNHARTHHTRMVQSDSPTKPRTRHHTTHRRLRRGQHIGGDKSSLLVA